MFVYKSFSMVIAKAGTGAARGGDWGDQYPLLKAHNFTKIIKKNKNVKKLFEKNPTRV